MRAHLRRRETGDLDGILGNFGSVRPHGHSPPDKVLVLALAAKGEPRAGALRIAEDYGFAGRSARRSRDLFLGAIPW